MARNLVNRLWQAVLQLNLYQKPSSTPETTREELIATRIYVCSLSIGLLIITVALAFIGRTVTKNEYAPSHTKFSQLISKYPNTLYCPCSTIGIPYDTFVTTHVSFHQVCSSRFIDQTWIDMLFTRYNTSSLSSDDFRLTLTFFWQLMKGFCIMSNRTWNDTRRAFGLSHIFSPTSMTENILQIQVKTTLENQINFAKTKLIHNLFALRRLTSGNQIVSALATNYYLRYPLEDINSKNYPHMSPRTFNDCSCLSIEGCPHPATINDNLSHSLTIPGMISDCLIIDSTLASTLECYYNQTCLSLLHPLLPISVEPLSNTLNTYFLMNSTIEILLNKLMIDEITNNTRFDLYYSQCNVSHCSYSFTHQFDILFIITTIIGIFGVLSFAMKLIARYAAKLILKWYSRRLPNNNVSDATPTQGNTSHVVLNHLRQFAHRTQVKIANLNLFERYRPRTHINISREKLLTRIFMFLLIISFIIAGIYTFFVIQDQVITISKPSIDTYQELHNNYTDTLQCPCTNLSIPYGSFLNVTYILHQICSSDLILSKWLNYLAVFDPSLLHSLIIRIGLTDFRTTGISYFQLLSTFCNLAEKNIKDAEYLFVNSQFINAYVLIPSFFHQQTQSMIESYISNTQNDYQRIFDWINIAFIMSKLLTGANTNFRMMMTNDSELIMGDVEYLTDCRLMEVGLACFDKCACPTESLTCFGSNLLYKNESYMSEFEQFFSEIPIGCIPLIGFLRSTFTWWYNETYLSNIQATYTTVIHDQSSPDIKPLNSSIISRFRTTDLKHLLEEMFLETWINHTDYNKFYNACAPSSCSYTISQRRPIIVALVILISICGGIYEILHILVPACGKLIFFLIDWRNNQNIQQGSPQRTSRVNHFFHLSYQSIININLYKTTSNDPAIVKQQKLHTKVYLILFISSLSGFLFYTAFVERTITKTYTLSTITDYEHLLNIYSHDLNCPCTYISLPYNDLITELQVSQYHHVCTTNIIPATLKSGVIHFDGDTYLNQDFRSFQDVFIEGLKQLCTLAKETVDNNIQQFRTSTMFVNQLISRNQFNNEMDIELNQFKEKVPIEFARILELIRTNIQGNALIAVFSTNWKFIMNENSQGNHTSFYSQPITYVDKEQNISCSCATSRFCTIPAQLFHYNGASFYSFEGLKLGCNSLETILLSSLSCFYSVSCIYDFRRKLIPISFMLPLYLEETNGTAEFNSSLTRFNINDTIETLAYEMFIESWVNNVSYENFFNSCAPTYCTYKLYYRFDALELLTNFLTVYGGLSFGIHFIVPYLIRIMKKIRNRYRVTPLQ